MLTASGIRIFRIAGAKVSLIAGLVIIATGDPAVSLGVAVLLLGCFIGGHAWIDYTFQRIRQDYNPPQDSGLRDFASAFVSTSGVILGLLAVFGDHPFSLTIKVGIAALVSDIMVGIVLVGLLLAGAAPDDQRAWNLIRYVFNVALWALSLGLLCIAMGLLYR